MKLYIKKSAQEKSAAGGATACIDINGDIPGLSELYFPEDSTPPTPQTQPLTHDILDILLEAGKITNEQYKQVRKTVGSSSLTGHNIENILVGMKIAGPEDILRAKAAVYGYEFQKIDPQVIQKEVFHKLNIDFIRNNSILPVAVKGKTLLVATDEPGNVFVIEEVRKITGMELNVVVCSREDVENACNCLAETKQSYNVDDFISDIADVEVVREEEGEFEDLEKMAGQSPVIKFVNYLISNAIRDGASDIHIEPKPKFTKIRYRIDGVLFETIQSPLQMHQAIVSRVKIMANLDISERRLPQDGKISAIVGGRSVDLRVSILPTSNGEKVVIRILESKSIMRGLEQLGMEQDTLEIFKKQIYMPHGILLVTGPTGSGKSTTLYSAIAQMDGDKLNISTVEDPVEYKLDFCNQVQANDKIGMTFASALRSLLRQDPNIIMIGEIRDDETARIAVQAALTGHLVLSTLHTNDAPSSVTRLVDIGIEPYLIAASLNGILAQRLVRKICPNCKQKFKAPEQFRAYLEKFGVSTNELYHGVGCDKCRGSGYGGRIGIYEILIVDEVFRDMVAKDPSVTNMRNSFRQRGGLTLFDDGLRKVKKGMTTIDEVLRVTEVNVKDKDEVLEENIT